jgi:hypothetical protein
MMKKLMAFIMVTMLLFSVTVTSENSIKVLLDGETIVFDTAPIIENGTTLVPLRAIFEALGATVQWYGDTNTVVSVLEDTTITLTINSEIAYKNDVPIELLLAPKIVNERTLVPVRFIAESFGLEVGWDGTTQTVIMTSFEDDVDWVSATIDSLGYTNNTLITVDGGDLSGSREANVKVDVGYGEREYWAFTNAYGQLVAVIAENIVLQDDETELVTSTGRYYADEAKVPGTESSDLDEGHVIADSLGGVSNAYNITPQNSNLNRYGDQAYMEKIIRQTNGCSEFVAIITYPNTNTQTPSHYSFTYNMMGNQINDEFDNIDTEDTLESGINENISTTTEENIAIAITNLDKVAEYVILTNNSGTDIDITNWRIVSEKGNQSFTFPNGSVLKAGASFTVTSGDLAGTGDFTMAQGTIWNNSDTDPAVLYDANGNEIDRY